MNETQSKGLLRSMMDVRRDEWPLALLMAGYFFLVITTFWILKPLKKGLFVGFYDDRGLDILGVHFAAAQAELIAKVANMVVAAGAVVVFTLLARRLVRQQLTLIFSGFFLAGFILYALVLDHSSHWVAWSFYLYGDLYATLMVATFFAFLNDSVTPSAARRLYGLIVLGGVAGGSLGATVVAASVKRLGGPIWMLVCGAIGIVIALLASSAGNIVRRKKSGAVAKRTFESSLPEPVKSSAALEGARLVFRSRYLFAIVLIVALYEIISTILDFQFTSTVAHYRDGPALKQQFARVYAITAVGSLVVQVFFTGFIMSRFRVTVALLVTPAAILFGSTTFLLLPLLWPGSLLNTWDNALSYSVNQSAREALYTPTSRDEKYKAKAFIDMFVQRFAKTLAVGVSLGVTLAFRDFATVRWLSLLAIALTVGWILAARSAGRRFHELAKEE